MSDELRNRAIEICRSREPGTPICASAPCDWCVEQARKELAQERVQAR